MVNVSIVLSVRRTAAGYGITIFAHYQGNARIFSAHALSSDIYSMMIEPGQVQIQFKRFMLTVIRTVERGLDSAFQSLVDTTP